MTAALDNNWLTSAPDGNQKFPVGYFLDPGHPAAADYLAKVYLDVVRNYAVDGIHFDYIRYPETTAVLPRGSAVGYNPVSVARFQRATARTDIPLPGDEAWMAWRRGQVTNLVRRVSNQAKAINPTIVISAAVIPWGRPPANEIDFADVAPMQRIFQDWHGWLHDRPERGWLGGVVRCTASADHDGAVVKVRRKRFWPFARATRIRADGNGYYGLANVKPGRYEVSTTIAGHKRKAIVTVAAGRVTSAPLD